MQRLVYDPCVIKGAARSVFSATAAHLVATIAALEGCKAKRKLKRDENEHAT